MNKRNNLRLLLIFILIGFVISPAFADETTINLDQQTPYVDIPIEATAPAQLTIQTITGTPQTNTGFIDSWIELWQGTTKLFANDDGAHSATNVLASIITTPVEAGVYFIRATSFAYMCCTQLPTGSYVLTWDGVTTIPTPTPTPEPTIEPTPTETVTPTPTIEPTPTETVTPQPEPIETSEPIAVVETPLPIPVQEILEEVTPEPEIVEQIVEEETIETPVVEPELSVEELQEQIQEQIDIEYIAENTIQLEIPTALENIPGAEQIFAATEAILNVGSDMTETQREESQSVVVGAILVTQVAQMASVVARRK